MDPLFRQHAPVDGRPRTERHDPDAASSNEPRANDTPVHEFRQELSGVVDNVPESIVVTAGEYSFHEHS
jgi:hypothetical protein